MSLTEAVGLPAVQPTLTRSISRPAQARFAMTAATSSNIPPIRLTIMAFHHVFY
jgi:hypothetical protein